MKIFPWNPDPEEWALRFTPEEGDRLFIALSASPSYHKNEFMAVLAEHFGFEYEPLKNDGSEPTKAPKMVPIPAPETVYATGDVYSSAKPAGPGMWNVYPVPATMHYTDPYTTTAEYLTGLAAVLDSPSMMQVLFKSFNDSGYSKIAAIKEIRTFMKNSDLNYSLYLAKFIFDALRENWKMAKLAGHNPEKVKFVL